ncbi:MAG: ABC transporter permease [Christensenellaceae bacterium]
MTPANQTLEGVAKRKFKFTPDGVQNLTIFGIFVAICIFGVVMEPSLFLSSSNLMNILVSTSSVIITASAVTMVLISGNLDLSVGGVGAMAGVLFALFALNGIPVLMAALLAVGCGALAGFLSGFIISKLSLPSFIISLAFKYIAGGIALIGAGGAIISSGLPGDIGNLGATYGGIPMPVVFAIAVFIIFLLLQNKTTFASKTYAIGANIKAAKLSGINTVKVITTVFMLSGIAAAFTGVIITSRFNVADSGILPGFETDCIIAAVLGGTDINGGRGTVFGMIIGALIIGVLSNIMNMMGLAIYNQSIVKGVVLILAILLNNLIRSKVKV